MYGIVPSVHLRCESKLIWSKYVLQYKCSDNCVGDLCVLLLNESSILKSYFYLLRRPLAIMWEVRETLLAHSYVSLGSTDSSLTASAHGLLINGSWAFIKLAQVTKLNLGLGLTEPRDM